jgi:DNA-binding GntR family transcriptional regulator
MKKDLQKNIYNTLFELLLESGRPVTEQMIGERLGVSRTARETGIEKPGK